MSERAVFDVILFGFRNDVARARVSELLAALPLSESGPLQIDAATAAPQRLFAALDRVRADTLCAQLQDAGAQVAIVDVAAHAIDALIGTPPARPVLSSSLATLVLLLAAAAVWYAHRQVDMHASASAGPAMALTPHLQSFAANSSTALQPDDAGRLNAEAIALVASEEYAAAVDRLQRALQSAPGDTVLTRNLQEVWLQWAVSDIKAQHYDEAHTHASQAAQLGDAANVLRVVGFVDMQEDRDADAVGALERALELAPNDRDVLLLLAQLYVKQNQRAQALALLQRAAAAGAAGPELERAIAQLSREVDTEWDFVELESSHFQVSFADSEDRHLVRHVLASLEDAERSVGAKFAYYPQERLPVVLYTQQDFHTVTQTPDWAGAAFDGRIKLPVGGLSDDEPQFDRMVRHEYAHSIIAELTGGHCPAWLNEGLAVWAEEERDGDHFDWAQRVVDGQPLFSFDQLSHPFAQLSEERVATAYAESYLAVRSLIDTYNARKIPALLEALRRFGDVAPAFEDVFPGTLGRFEQQFLRQLTGN